MRCKNHSYFAINTTLVIVKSYNNFISRAKVAIPVTNQDRISECLSDINSRQCFVIMVFPYKKH